jgi:hypothetical protein
LHSHILLKELQLLYCYHTPYVGRCNALSESEINIPERLQKIGQTVQEYRDAVVKHFKDMEVDVKDWNFKVGKAQEEYTVEISVKLGIKPKPKQ